MKEHTTETMSVSKESFCAVDWYKQLYGEEVIIGRLLHPVKRLWQTFIASAGGQYWVFLSAHRHQEEAEHVLGQMEQALLRLGRGPHAVLERFRKEMGVIRSGGDALPEDLLEGIGPNGFADPVYRRVGLRGPVRPGSRSPIENWSS